MHGLALQESARPALGTSSTSVVRSNYVRYDRYTILPLQTDRQSLGVKAGANVKFGVNVTSYNHGHWERLLANDFSRPPTVPDVTFVDRALAFGELVEPLGFDSIWTTEHYGSAYSMQPNPLQWLAYWAGRTSRIDLGTAVIVVPWWNPVRLAHELSMLDVLLKGRRLMVGLGRGVSEHEYASLGVSRDSSREIFYETLDVLRLADTQERFSYSGKIWDIPPTTVRPQARHKGHLMDGARAAFTTRRSAELAAEAGLGQLFVAGEPLEVMREQVAQFNEIRASKGFGPDQATAVLFMYCAETEQAAAEGYEYFHAQGQASNNHYYQWNTGGFEGVAGYEEYAAKLAAGKTTPSGLFEQEASQLIGTPDSIIDKLRTLHDTLDLSQVVLHVSYGGMPPEKATQSLTHFAHHVLPTAHTFTTTT